MFNTLTTCYLFLGGAGAGALGVLSFLEGARQRGWRSLAMPKEFFARAWPLCTATLGVGALCLFVDLGRPDRALLLFVSPRPSAIAVGSFALAASLGCSAVFSALSLFDGPRPGRVLSAVLAVLGMAASLATALYTGVLLEGLASVVFWQTPFLPVLFALSSASCGLALAFLAAAFVETRGSQLRPLAGLARADAALLIAEAACLAVYLLLSLARGETADAARALVFGDLSFAFWGVLAAGGLAAPLVLERFLARGNRQALLVWIAALLLVGGFALRFCMVGAGSYDATQVPAGLYGLSISGLQG